MKGAVEKEWGRKDLIGELGTCSIKLKSPNIEPDSSGRESE